MHITISRVPWDDADAVALRAAQEAELHDRYGGPDPHPPTGPDVALFLVARDRAGTAVGCGGLRPLDTERIEIKRMYVTPPARGNGLSRQILAALEAAASADGWRTMRLETGVMQPEAISLYRSSGYAQIDRYGAYVDDEWSLCFEKHLVSPA